MSAQYPDLIGKTRDERAALFSTVVDYLVYLDVVSLYPYSAVAGMFPVGPVRKLKDLECKKLCEFINEFTLETDHHYHEDVLKSFFIVDVSCPSNLITPFLFSRGPKNELVQDLLPKIQQTYDGHTLLEASLLGYKITAVYEGIQYKYLDNPLKGFMCHAFEQKSLSPKDSVAYTIHKYLMNGLTGKFNQMLVDVDWKVIYKDTEISSLLKKPQSEVKQFEWLLSMDSKILGQFRNFSFIFANFVKVF